MGNKRTQTVIVLFAFINLIGFLAAKGYWQTKLKINFLLVVNALLLLMYFFNIIRLSKLDKNNPNAMIRSVMIGTLLKMVVFIGVAMAYTTQVKVPVGMSTLLGSMGLYLVYTWLEIKGELVKK
jgi:hypothetical protein